MTELHQIDTTLSPKEAIEELSRASEFWGASWQPHAAGGHLELPVLAGLKHGFLSGPVTVEPIAEGSRITFQIEERHYRLQTSAVAILSLGAIGGIAATLWPFFPPLIGVAPLAIVIAIGAWILVASRLRTSTPDEFLELVAGEDPSKTT
jgi:hypothetical protein